MMLTDGSVVGCEVGSNHKFGHPGFDSHKALKTPDLPDTPVLQVTVHKKEVKVWCFPHYKKQKTKRQKKIIIMNMLTKAIQ